MSVQTVAPTIRFRTIRIRAFERFLAGMAAMVLVQVTADSKRFVTATTLEGFLARVGALMMDETVAP